MAEGHSITAVAKAVSKPGKTPNRGAIYDVLRNRNVQRKVEELPFSWQPRDVETAAGTRTVYDLTAELEMFGPDEITGWFRWRYDTATHELDPVLDEDDPYPSEAGFYTKMLSDWLERNPYPGGE